VRVSASNLLADHATDAVCDLETVGRVTGRRRTVEIWFATDGERLYLLSGGRDRAHWVRNLVAEPRVRLRIGDRVLSGRARVIEGEARDPVARRLLAAKYQGWTEGRALSAWAASSLPVEVELDA